MNGLGFFLLEASKFFWYFYPIITYRIPSHQHILCTVLYSSPLLTKLSTMPNNEELSEQVLNSEQALYVQSSIDACKWIEQSTMFRKKVHYYMRFIEYEQQKKRSVDNLATHASLNRFAFDIHTRNFSFEDIEKNDMHVWNVIPLLSC